jgi:hypothetical protein
MEKALRNRRSLHAAQQPAAADAKRAADRQQQDQQSRREPAEEQRILARYEQCEALADADPTKKHRDQAQQALIDPEMDELEIAINRPRISNWRVSRRLMNIGLQRFLSCLAFSVIATRQQMQSQRLKYLLLKLLATGLKNGNSESVIISPTLPISACVTDTP